MAPLAARAVDLTSSLQRTYRANALTAKGWESEGPLRYMHAQKTAPPAGGGGERTFDFAESALRACYGQPWPVSETWRPNAPVERCRGPQASNAGCEAPDHQMQAVIVLLLVSGCSAGRANSSLEHEQQVFPHPMNPQKCYT